MDRELSKGNFKRYTKKASKSRTTFKNCIDPLCKVRQKQNRIKARHCRKPVIFQATYLHKQVFISLSPEVNIGHEQQQWVRFYSQQVERTYTQERRRQKRKNTVNKQQRERIILNTESTELVQYTLFKLKYAMQKKRSIKRSQCRPHTYRTTDSFKKKAPKVWKRVEGG